jgi:hypothetical protein
MHLLPKSRDSLEVTTTAGRAATPGKGMGAVTQAALAVVATEAGVTDAGTAA